MSKWIKKTVAPESVKDLVDRYDCDSLTAAIFLRRGITDGQDILYYMEDDKRYLHNPFLFNNMEDAVDRIKQAKDEGERVLIFGDSDVDGITATTLLFNYLEQMGMEVTWKVPCGDDPYGLTIEAIDEFSKNYGSLIITVDCGISNNQEVMHAASLGIDVIIVDHHTPPDEMPSPAIIIDPKDADSGYPFREISGCAVAYKLVSALRFSEFELYKQQICLLNIRPVNEAYVIEALKMVNLVEIDRITETIIPDMLSINQTRLPSFLQGQQILCWDEPLQVRQLEKIFGRGDLINMLDVRGEISKAMPSLASASLLRLKAMSKIAKYSESPSDELDAFFNLFVTFASKQNANKKDAEQDSLDLQLVALSTLADIMPLKNENRILVKQGLAAINSGKLRQGLQELFQRLDLLAKPITATTLSWNVNPVLNAAGRLGKPDIAVKLFTEKDASSRNAFAQQIIDLNVQRKELEADALKITEDKAYKSLEQYKNKLVVVADERIHSGVTGLVANKLAKQHKVPAIVITFVDENSAVGSVRSSCGVEVLGILHSASDLFTNYGGHDFAAGFSFTKGNVDEVLARFDAYTDNITINTELEEKITIDAELPHTFMTPETKAILERFEPFGQENAPLALLCKKVKIVDANVMGKGERLHLKLTLDCGKHKWPALFWSEAERLNRDFAVGDLVDIVFSMDQNVFNGSVTQQLILKDCIKSEA